MSRQSRTLDTFIQYGVTSELAKKATLTGLTVSASRSLSVANLVKHFNLTTAEAKTLHTCVRRQPIDENVAHLLLERSNFLCCACKGSKSVSYIIHHIVGYEETQDNGYDNLAVLCPADHDLAHQGGLTLNLSARQIIKLKAEWEKQVEIANAQRAAQLIKVSDDAIDYVNVKRIEELCVRLFGNIPDTELTRNLRNSKILKPDNSFDQPYVQKKLSGGRYLFDYITHNETEHYRQLLQKISGVTEFIDLDQAAADGVESLKSAQGQYAFFIGGVHAKSPKMPITNSTPAITMYYSKKGLRIEWILDPNFLMSTSAISRIGGKNRYIIYCLVRTVEQTIDKVTVKASPLLIAQPTAYVDKTPVISHMKQYDALLRQGFISEDDQDDSIE